MKMLVMETTKQGITKYMQPGDTALKMFGEREKKLNLPPSRSIACVLIPAPEGYEIVPRGVLTTGVEAKPSGHMPRCKRCDLKKTKKYRIDHYPDGDPRKQPGYFERVKAEKQAVLDAMSPQEALEYKKKQARALVGTHIKYGKLIPLPCSVCGSSPAEAHHDDYDQPLSVRWLCLKHHRKLHAKSPNSTELEYRSIV